MLDGLLGNAKQVDKQQIANELAPVLIDGEGVLQAFKVIRDLYVFTTKRLLLVDKQGMTGKKVEYHSIPYSKVTHFSVETAGSFDRDSELKIWISGGGGITKEFKKGTDIVGIQRMLATYVLG